MVPLVGTPGWPLEPSELQAAWSWTPRGTAPLRSPSGMRVPRGAGSAVAAFATAAASGRFTLRAQSPGCGVRVLSPPVPQAVVLGCVPARQASPLQPRSTVASYQPASCIRLCSPGPPSRLGDAAVPAPPPLTVAARVVPPTQSGGRPAMLQGIHPEAKEANKRKHHEAVARAAAARTGAVKAAVHQAVHPAVVRCQSPPSCLSPPMPVRSARASPRHLPCWIDGDR